MRFLFILLLLILGCDEDSNPIATSNLSLIGSWIAEEFEDCDYVEEECSETCVNLESSINDVPLPEDIIKSIIVTITENYTSITVRYDYIEGNEENCTTYAGLNNMPLIWDSVANNCFFSQSSVMLQSIVINENEICGYVPEECDKHECYHYEFSNNGNTLSTYSIVPSVCVNSLTECIEDTELDQCNLPTYSIDQGHCITSILNRQ